MASSQALPVKQNAAHAGVALQQRRQDAAQPASHIHHRGASVAGP